MDGTAVQEPPTTTPSASTSATTPLRKKSLPQHSLQANVPLVIMTGLAVAVGCAALWAVISAVTGYQIGWMAIGVGFAVGHTIRLTGNGQAPIFGIAGAGLSLLGCMLGNLFIIYHYIAEEGQQSFLSVMAANLSAAPTHLISTAQPMDLLFYGLAIYYGYKLSLQS